MTIRAKLYAAIVLTVLGPLATTAVALNGMSQMGDRFDEVQERSQHESLARELKFQVTDMNGWQTAYGYAGGPLAGAVHRLGQRASAPAGRGEGHAHRRARAGAARASCRATSIRSCNWTRSPGASSRPGNGQRTRQILLGPELRRFEAMAATADDLARYEEQQAAVTESAFNDARDDARRILVAVALGAAVVIVLLLVTANDIAKMALEGERSVRERSPRKAPDDGTS